MDESPIGERAHRAGHPHRRAVAIVHLAAHLDGHRGADPRLHARLHRGRVPDARDRRAPRAHPQQLAQDLGAVARRAAAGVVGHVREHDRPAVGGERLGHRVLHRQRGVDELVPMPPRHPCELIGEALGQGLIVVGDHVDAETRVGDVRVREAREERDRDDLGVLLHLVGQVVEAPHRAARGALPAERRHERRLAPGRGRLDAPGDHLGQSLGRLHPALGHVHVRVGLVPVQEIGASDHVLAQVAVEVEGHRDRHVGAHRSAHRRDDVALPVVHALRDHRPVQVEEHAVEPARRLEIGQHALLDVLVDVAGDEPGRRGGGGHRRQQRHAQALGRRDHAPQAGAGAAIGLDDFTAVAQVARLELGAIGGDIAEGIGLVRQHGEEHSHAGLL